LDVSISTAAMWQNPVISIFEVYRSVLDEETDTRGKHVEFFARHRTTGEQVAVEAKRRHRPGVLGYPRAGYKADSDPEPHITGLLRTALAQRRPMPYMRRRRSAAHCRQRQRVPRSAGAKLSGVSSWPLLQRSALRPCPTAVSERTEGLLN